MVCLGFEPRMAGWQAQTNPLSYGGIPKYPRSLPQMRNWIKLYFCPRKKVFFTSFSATLLIFPAQKMYVNKTKIICFDGRTAKRDNTLGRQNGKQRGPPQLSGFVCDYHPAVVPGSNSKHTIYLCLYIVTLCSVFVIELRKGQN